MDLQVLQKPPEWLVKAAAGGGRPQLRARAAGLVCRTGCRRADCSAHLVADVPDGLRRQKKEGAATKPRRELSEYPPLKPSTGDRQLRVEGVPVRMRLVVIAPAGKDGEVDADDAEEMLERVLPGLGEIYRGDKPRVKVWPRQLSYEGFVKHFQRNMLTPEGEGEPSRWVLIGGRAKLGKQQIMLGLGLQAIKPTTVGRRTIDAHEWPTVLRVRVRDRD